ncbi:MAG: DinB family protein [Acidimicrobiales bacterium]
MPLNPDTKDWTWVLTKRCPECGFDASDFEQVAPGEVILSQADSWQTVLSGTSCSQRTDPDRWSALEYGCHVRDVFRIFQERVTNMLELDEPLFANWDQDATAIEERYDTQDPATVRQELKDAATTLAATFGRVEGAQWERRGTRSDGRHFTVRTLSLYLLHDPFHHLWDVTPSRTHS